MSLSAVSDRDFPPAYSKRFTSFVAQLVLHAADAPASQPHLPSMVVVEHDVADVFAYTDLDSTVKSITFPVAGVTPFRMAPATIETTTTATAVTVFWNQRAP